MRHWTVNAQYVRKEDAEAAAALLREVGGALAITAYQTKVPKDVDKWRSGKLFLDHLPANLAEMQAVFKEHGYATSTVSSVATQLAQGGLVAIRNKGKRDGSLRYVRRVRLKWNPAELEMKDEEMGMSVDTARSENSGQDEKGRVSIQGNRYPPRAF